MIGLEAAHRVLGRGVELAVDVAGVIRRRAVGERREHVLVLARAPDLAVRAALVAGEPRVDVVDEVGGDRGGALLGQAAVVVGGVDGVGVAGDQDLQAGMRGVEVGERLDAAQRRRQEERLRGLEQEAGQAPAHHARRQLDGVRLAGRQGHRLALVFLGAHAGGACGAC